MAIRNDNKNIIVGQAMATIIYIRNIMLIVKHRGKASKTLDR